MDNGWGMFVNMLAYKLKERGKLIVVSFQQGLHHRKMAKDAAGFIRADLSELKTQYRII